MLPEKLDRAAPGEFGGVPVMDGRALLVDEGVIRVVAEELELFASGLQPGLEGVDRGRRDEFVAIGEMALQRNLDVGGLDCPAGGNP